MVKNEARDENANSNVKRASFSNEIRDIRIVLNEFSVEICSKMLVFIR